MALRTEHVSRFTETVITDFHCLYKVDYDFVIRGKTFKLEHTLVLPVAPSILIEGCVFITKFGVPAIDLTRAIKEGALILVQGCYFHICPASPWG